MSSVAWEIKGYNHNDFCLSFSLSYAVVKSFTEQDLYIYIFIHNNHFCMIPQLLNNFHIDFKSLDLSTWFAEEVYLPSMKQMSCPLKTFYFRMNAVI